MGTLGSPLDRVPLSHLPVQVPTLCLIGRLVPYLPKQRSYWSATDTCPSWNQEAGRLPKGKSGYCIRRGDRCGARRTMDVHLPQPSSIAHGPQAHLWKHTLLPFPQCGHSTLSLLDSALEMASCPPHLAPWVHLPHADMTQGLACLPHWTLSSLE